jgi:hypothetical protein
MCVSARPPTTRDRLLATTWVMAERRQRMEPKRCMELLDLLASLPIDTQDESDRLRVYDAVHLDLSLSLKCPCIALRT